MELKPRHSIEVNIYFWMRFLWQQGREYRPSRTPTCIIDHWQLELEWQPSQDQVLVIFPSEASLSMFLLKYSTDPVLKDYTINSTAA